MTTTVTIIVRQDDTMFHGQLARVEIDGDGRPAQYQEAVRAAIAAAGLEYPQHWAAGIVPPRVPAVLPATH